MEHLSVAKTKKQQEFIKNKQKETVVEKVYEIQNGKSINDLRNSIAQFQYPLVINLIPIERQISEDSLNFGSLVLTRDREKSLSEFNKGIVGISISQNERILLNVLATLVSNSNFQIDVANKQVDLSKVWFRFPKKIIRELSGITDIKTLIRKLSEPLILKTNNRGGEYIVDRLFQCYSDKENKSCYKFRFSKYLAYDYQNKSVKGYAKRRGFYNKKRHSKYETLFLELLFTKTAKFKDKQAPTEFSIKIKTLLQSIKLYDMVHEHRKRVVDYLKDFFKAAFEFGVFIGKPPVFEAKTLNRDDLSKITLTINPDFDWTKCDWDKWNIKKG